jgi:hypothetical protein
MSIHKTLIYLAFSLAYGCAASDSQPLERSAVDSATPKAAGSATLPAAAPAANVVQPISVRKEGRNLIRTFELRPGEAFKMDTGAIKVSAIRDVEIVLDRNLGEWKISAEPAEYHVGNSDYIEVISIDHEAPSLRLELRTKTKSNYPWDAYSF